jgi:MFS family permease
MGRITDAIERIVSTLKSGFGMTFEKFSELFIGFGKVYAATTLFLLAGWTATILAAYVPSLVSGVLAILGILLVILVIVIAGGIAMSSNTLVDNVANNKKFKLIETIKNDWMRNSVYVVAMGLLGIIVSIPIIIGQFVDGIAGLFFFAIGLLVYLVWIFITQFAYWEYVIGRKGIIESIKSSYSAVMDNLAFVFGLDIIVGILMMMVAVIFYIIILIVTTLMLIVVFMGGATTPPGANPSDLLPLLGTGIIATALVFAVLALMMSVVMETLFKPVHYYTWKGATRKK